MVVAKNKGYRAKVVVGVNLRMLSKLLEGSVSMLVVGNGVKVERENAGRKLNVIHFFDGVQRDGMHGVVTEEVSNNIDFSREIMEGIL